MAGIGAGGGATTTFSPSGTMNTRVSAGDQADAYSGGDGYDPYAFIKKLRADKEQSRREAAMWDEGRAERRDFQTNALSAAPEDPHMAALSAARTQADVSDYLQGRKEAGIERTRQDMIQRTRNDPSAMPVMVK